MVRFRMSVAGDDVQDREIAESSSNDKVITQIFQRNKSMDNIAFDQDGRSTELQHVREVSVSVERDCLTTNTTNTILTAVVDGTNFSTLNGNNKAMASTSSGYTCNAEACVAARRKYLEPGPNSLSQSPWHARKTYYLITVIGLLIIWIIIFSVLNKYNVL